jgi:hypothetical protein
MGLTLNRKAEFSLEKAGRLTRREYPERALIDVEKLRECFAADPLQERLHRIRS